MAARVIATPTVISMTIVRSDTQSTIDRADAGTNCAAYYGTNWSSRMAAVMNAFASTFDQSLSMGRQRHT